MLRILRKREELPEPPIGAEALVELPDDAMAFDVNDEEEEQSRETTDENGETVADDAESCGENISSAKEEIGFSPEFEIEARAFAKGRQYPDAQLEEGLSLMREIGMAWTDSALTVEMLEVLIRGLDYERAVAQAAEEGEIRGRNTQIDEKYMRPDDSDGLPHLPGKGNVGRGSRGVSSIFDLARDAG